MNELLIYLIISYIIGFVIILICNLLNLIELEKNCLDQKIVLTVGFLYSPALLPAIIILTLFWITMSVLCLFCKIITTFIRKKIS